MRPSYGLTLPVLAWAACLVASAACRSLPRREESEDEEARLIKADSEVFEAVVRAQLAGTEKQHPFHIDRLRYDSRPYGTRSGYPENSAGVQGVAPTLSFAAARRRAIERIVENRKRILQMTKAREGGPFFYRQCAGAGVPPPPPRSSGSAARSKPTDVHAGCPKRSETYFTVGLPVRGQPEGLRNFRDSHGQFVRLTGEVWTTIVEERSAGPSGWSWSQYGWLLKRNRWNGRLELAATILTGIVE